MGMAWNGRIISSNSGLVCKRKEGTKPDSVVKVILKVPSLKQVRTEEAAARLYVKEMKAGYFNLSDGKCIIG